jgi:ABC-type phosphate transport system ATPase subunit
MQKSPYKFLDSYSKEDRDIFFGRDKEIEELHSRVFESRILIVYGTSGTGKSSLINCGLANKFNDSDWLPITVRRGININQSLLDSLDRTGLTKISSGKEDSAGNKTNDIIR